MSMVLEVKTGEFKPHPEGIHPAVCVDVIDLGMVEEEYLGQRRITAKVRLVFESEQQTEEGVNCTVAKTFTASLNAKSRLAEFLGKWRGRPLMAGERIDLEVLKGVPCTLVVSHQQNMAGRTYASIDAVSKPTKKLAPSGSYDPVRARERMAEWKARQAGALAAAAPQARTNSAPAAPQRNVALVPQPSAPVPPGYDPEVGF